MANQDYKRSNETFLVIKARFEAEIEATTLTEEEVKAAIKLAKTHKWRLFRRGENDSMKAVSNDLKKD